jgi:hypothetical protein
MPDNDRTLTVTMHVFVNVMKSGPFPIRVSTGVPNTGELRFTTDEWDRFVAQGGTVLDPLHGARVKD